MPVLGCIADDFTGATDLGAMLVRGGMRTVQWLDVPTTLPPIGEIDAIVISLKTRSVAAPEAIELSLAALESLRASGCEKFLFKYCSTFDSTDEGNIGPVAAALLDSLDAAQTIFCPAFPENRRTVYQGHLFVGDKLLNESGMQHHPSNPMRDANLVRVLGRQSNREIGLVDYSIVSHGSEAIRKELDRLSSSGCRFVIADAMNDDHLEGWARAVNDYQLVTGGSAIAKHIAGIQARQGELAQIDRASRIPEIDGKSAVLAGSCSSATQQQVEQFKLCYPTFTLVPQQLENEMDAVIDQVIEWSMKHLGRGPVLVASTAAPHEVQQARNEVGDKVAQLVESAFARIASELVGQGVRKLVIAGGETSGAVLQSLGITQLSIGAEIDPGVPWTTTVSNPRMALALKSGNFGGDDFFLRALEMLE